MAVETDADLAVFFNADEFAVVATYRPATGIPVEVTVIPDRPDGNADLGRLGITAVSPTVQIRMDELPAGSPARGDHLDLQVEGRTVTFAVVPGGSQAEISGRVMRLRLNEIDE